MPERPTPIDSFNLVPGRTIGGKYAVESFLGAGWEGEVYRVVEQRTGARRAAKLFFPHRNDRDRAVRFCARKLEQLRACPIVLKYHHSETIRYRGTSITALVSEYIDGEILEDLVDSRPGKRLPEFEALTILHEVVLGLEQIHASRAYHGDLHAGNVMVKRRGIRFELKLVDLYDHGTPSLDRAREDVVNAIRLLYDMLGGQRRYHTQRPEIKRIICGLKRSIIARRFPSARVLREHLESFDWADD